MDDHGFRFTNLCNGTMVVSYCDPHAAETRWACGDNHFVTGDHGETQPYYTVDRSIDPGVSISTFRLEDHERRGNCTGRRATLFIRFGATQTATTGARQEQLPKQPAHLRPRAAREHAPSWGQSPEHAGKDGCWQPPKGCVATTASLERERLVLRVTNNCTGDVYVRF